jgi:hypothetical protein
LGVSVTRYAIGSTGFKTLMKNSNANIISNTDVVTELTGLNNVTGESNIANSTSIIAHGLLTFFANQWASFIVNGANSMMTRAGGTFTGYAAATPTILQPTNNAFGGKYGLVNGQSLPNVTDAVYTSTPGAYIEYTDTFKHAIVALVGGNGNVASYNSTIIPSGVVKIYLDGNLVTTPTLDLSQQYPEWPNSGGGVGSDIDVMGPVMFGITAPVDTLHTIKIELVSGDMALDYIAVLDNPANCYPVVVGEIPYVYPSVWGVGSQATADSYSSIKQVYANLYKNKGFPVRYCAINAPTGPYNYVGNVLPFPDLTHPNVTGNQQIASAFEALFV